MLTTLLCLWQFKGMHVTCEVADSPFCGPLLVGSSPLASHSLLHLRLTVACPGRLNGSSDQKVSGERNCQKERASQLVVPARLKVPYWYGTPRVVSGILKLCLPNCWCQVALHEHAHLAQDKSPLFETLATIQTRGFGTVPARVRPV